MTGLPTLTVELEDGSGNFTNDITGYVRRRSFTVSRGWSDENDEDDVQPAELKLDLDNKSGEFTLGSASFSGITKDKRIRVSETVGGTTYRRFVGYVLDWPTKWESALANMAIAGITARDRFTRMNRHKLLSMTEQEILLDSPLAYFKLAEATGAGSAGDTSGNGRAAVQPEALFGGTLVAPTFGTALTGAADDMTGAAFNNDSISGAASTLIARDIPAPTSGTVTIECAFVASTTSSFGMALVSTDGGISLSLDSSGRLKYLTSTSTASYADGQVHHAALVRTYAGGWSLYADGALVSTVAGGAITAPTGTVQLSVAEQTSVVATFAHVAIYDGDIGATRIAAHADAIRSGFATDTADQRIARLASYAGIATADQNLEAGQQPSIAAQGTAGQSVLDAMRDVAQAEGGGLFIAGDGKLTLHNKSHRVLKATAAPAVTVTADSVDWRDAEFESLNYLFNTATGSRSGGAEQRSVNQVSVGKYDEWPIDRSKALLPTDELVLNELTWITTMYAEPLARLSSVTFDLLTLPQATVQAFLALELGDHIRITGFPAQAPASSLDLIVEGFKEAATEETWKVTFNTAPAQLFYAWVLGDATYGVLGSTTRLYR